MLDLITKRLVLPNFLMFMIWVFLKEAPINFEWFLYLWAFACLGCVIWLAHGIRETVLFSIPLSELKNDPKIKEWEKSLRPYDE